MTKWLCQQTFHWHGSAYNCLAQPSRSNRQLPLQYLHEVSYRRELIVKIILFGIRGLFGGGIALYDVDISYSSIETSGYKSFRYGFPRQLTAVCCFCPHNAKACSAGRTFVLTRVKKYIAIYRQSVYSAPQPSSFTHAQFVDFIPHESARMLSDYNSQRSFSRCSIGKIGSPPLLP